MHIEQIYTGCLAQAAYYIESDGEAAVIDPLREAEPYIRRAARDNARIRYVLETHFHADFVSGHLELATRTGATIVYGPAAQPGFAAHIATDGEWLQLGRLRIKVLHTPGHTMESTCYLLCDEAGREHCLFTGDTLFIGDVGRPDLAQKVAADLTPEKLSALLYDSLHKKILPLSDDIILYPGHGAGSACGKHMSRETIGTLGREKACNYALQPMSPEEFRQKITEGLLPPPGYFPANVRLNIRGPERMDTVLQRGLQGLAPEAFDARKQPADVLVLDTRAPQDFAAGFIPGSLNIGIDGSFAPWAGALITDLDQEILLVTEEGRQEEAVTRLARVGHDRVTGYLQGGIRAWRESGRETDTVASVTAAALADKLAAGEKPCVLDVRKQGEYDTLHIDRAINIPLDDINRDPVMPDPSVTCYVHCAGGYRSLIFISIMRSRGYRRLIDVEGGFSAITETGRFSLSGHACPATMR